MIRALLAKAVRDARLLLLGLALLMFLVAWINIWTSSRISLPAFTEFLLNAVPERWERVSGVPFREVATPAGRVALVYVHPFILLSAAVWAIARGSDCVSGEIGRGTMEILLAPPVSRHALYGTQALATALGAALLASAAWCGTAVGLATAATPQDVPASRFIPPAVNLFGLMVCLGGMSAMASSWESQRWRTVGLMGAWNVGSTILKVVGRMSDGWRWVGHASFMSAFEPQALVARPAEAWSLLAYRDGAVAGLGLGGQQLVLLGLGLISYAAGAVIFNRRQLPAPL